MSDLHQLIWPSISVGLFNQFACIAYLSIAATLCVLVGMFMTYVIEFQDGDSVLGISVMAGIFWPITLIPCTVGFLCWLILYFLGKTK